MMLTRRHLILFLLCCPFKRAYVWLSPPVLRESKTQGEKSESTRSEATNEEDCFARRCFVSCRFATWYVTHSDISSSDVSDITTGFRE